MSALSEALEKAEIRIKQAFGINGPIRDNIIASTTDLANGEKAIVIFPVGSHVAIYDPSDRSKKFFQTDRNAIPNISAMSLSPNKKFVALCSRIRGGDGARIAIFNVLTQREVISLLHRNSLCSMCFSGDSKYLIGASKDSVVVWLWEREKVEYSASVTSQITRISCPPRFGSSTLMFTSTGPAHFRLWTASIRQRLSNATVLSSQSKEQSFNFVDHVWLRQSIDRPHLMAVIIESKLTTDSSVTTKECTVVVYLLSETNSQWPTLEFQLSVPIACRKGVQVLSIATSNTLLGFYLGGSSGYFGAYELKNMHQENQSFLNTKMLYRDEEDKFSSVCVGQDDNHVLLYSQCRGAYVHSNGLGSFSDYKHEKSDFEQVFPEGLHRGGILDMDCSIQRPTFITCGTDGGVRIWNYATCRCEVVSEFEHDAPRTVAIHPNGHQALVGFKDRICMYYVLVDSLRQFRQNHCRACRKVLFSPGGSLFAAAAGTFIKVYATCHDSKDSSFLLTHNLIGNASSVTSIFWTRDDMLYSTAMEGNIYGWDLRFNTRTDNINVLPCSTHYTDLIVEPISESTDFYYAAVCCADGILSTLCWDGNKTTSCNTKSVPVTSPDSKITAICLSVDKKVLYAGTSGGNIRCYDWPLSDRPSHREMSLHGRLYSGESDLGTSQVTCIKTTMDYIISTSEDGSIFLFRLEPANKSMLSVAIVSESQRRAEFTDEVVLVSRESYEEFNEKIIELERTVRNMKNDNEFALHSKDSLWQAEMKVLSKTTEELILGERNRYAELQKRYDDTIELRANEIDAKSRVHALVIQELEAQHQTKLAEEVERYGQLDRESKSVQSKFDESLKEHIILHESKIIALEKDAKSVQKQLNATVSTMKEEATSSEKIFREILDQQEEEYETELMQLKAFLDDQAHQEHNKFQKMREAMQKTNAWGDQLSRYNEILKAKADTNEGAHKSELGHRKQLESEIEMRQTKLGEQTKINLQQEIENKDLISQKNALENFRCVLEAQVQEAQDEKIPLELKNRALQEEIAGLNIQMKKDQLSITNQQLLFDQMQMKMKAQEREMSAAGGIQRAKEREIEAMKYEIEHIMSVAADKILLQGAVRQAYQKHIKGGASQKGKLEQRKTPLKKRCSLR